MSTATLTLLLLGLVSISSASILEKMLSDFDKVTQTQNSGDDDKKLCEQLGWNCGTESEIDPGTKTSLDWQRALSLDDTEVYSCGVRSHGDGPYGSKCLHCGTYRTETYEDFQREWIFHVNRCMAHKPMEQWCMGALWCPYRNEYLDYCSAHSCYRNPREFKPCRIPEDVWARIYKTVEANPDFFYQDNDAFTSQS